MKKQILTAVAMLSLLVTLSVAGAARSMGRIRVNIPFDFMVGKAKLPAGEYTVDQTGMGSVLRISSFERRANAYIQTVGGKTGPEQAQTKLEFHRYGEEYFLAQVWEEGSTVARQLLKSRAEREAAKRSSNHLARNEAEPAIVTVLAQ